MEERPLPAQLGRLCQRIRELSDSVSAHDLQSAHSYVGVLEEDRRLRDDQRADLEDLLGALAELDALSAMSHLLDEGYCLTDIGEDGGTAVDGVGVWHPFLPGGVPNPISLRGGETLVFLTGPNMAGKTTYLRAVGVCVYLAQCGLPVPAQRFSLSPVDRFITGLSPEDNLREGVSYFLAEVRRVKEVVEAVVRGERTIAIFDEVFRGTNVTDALDASKAVLVGCSRAESSIFIFSSHLVELADELKDRASIKFCYFEGTLEGNRLSFDYRLRPGVSGQRFGMELLRREGVPGLLDSIPT